MTLNDAIAWITSDPQVDTWEAHVGPASGGSLVLTVMFPGVPDEFVLRRVDLYTAPPEVMHAWYADRLDMNVRPGDRVEFRLGLSI